MSSNCKSAFFSMHRGILATALVIALPVLAGNPASAQLRGFIHRFCIEDLIVVERPEIGPIVPGCEVIDCCPGCPGPGPLTWRIRFEADPIETMVLRFEDITPAELERIKIEGNGKWLAEGQLQIGTGETVISGILPAQKGRRLAAIPEFPRDVSPLKNRLAEMDAASAAAQDKGLLLSDEAGNFDLSVVQYLGPVPVNEFHVFVRLRRCFPPAFDLDQIDLDNNATGDNAVVLLDARHPQGCVDDEVWRGSNVISVGDVRIPLTCNNEVAVFSDDDAMQLVSGNAWTNALGDVQRVNQTPNLLLNPVSAWLLVPNTAGRANGDVAMANLLFNGSNCGTGFNAQATDVSNQPAAVNLVGTNSNTMCGTNWLNALTSSAFFTPGRLNAYYVNGAFTALNCIFNPNVSVVGTTANNQSLAHEFGHAFTLSHTNLDPAFPASNVMQGGGSNRTEFTEGQCFRVNLNPTSMLNVNGVRTGSTRNCPDSTTSTQCPARSLDVAPN